MDDFSPKRVSTDWIKVCFADEINDIFSLDNDCKLFSSTMQVLNFSFCILIRLLFIMFTTSLVET